MESRMMKFFKKSRLLRFYRFLKGKWVFHYFFGLFVSGTQSFVTVFIQSMGVKWMADGIQSGSMGSLVNGAIFLAAGLLGAMIIIPLFWVQFYRAGIEIKRNVLYALYDNVYRLPQSYIEQHHSGDLISRLTNDVETSEKAYGWQIKMLIQSSLSGIGGMVTIFVLDWRLGAATAGIGILIVILNAVFAKPMRRISRKVQESLSGAAQRLSDIIAGREIIKTYILSKVVRKLYDDENLQTREWSMKQAKLNAGISAGGNLIYMLSYLGFFVLGGIFIIRGEITVGTMLAAVSLSGGALWIFHGFGDFIRGIQESLAGADRIFEILDAPKEEPQSAEADGKKVPSETGTARDALVLQDVSFCYQDRNPVFTGLSLSVQEKEIVALVGSSGGGKSTLLKLLLGFYNPDEGQILLDGTPLGQYGLRELRRHFAYVPQNTYLFDGTIGENISYGSPGASRERVEECARSAYAHGFISRLKEEYDSVVGERGIHLSGGQRQRIAIARALLKDAPILLLDEATASLDSESEQEVQKALEVLMRDRTVMVIAHRLSTVRQADRILVMEAGRIVEEGNHEKLMTLEGRYAELYAMQFV
jgi:ATP-binding cassette subfamily B protein